MIEEGCSQRQVVFRTSWWLCEKFLGGFVTPLFGHAFVSPYAGMEWGSWGWVRAGSSKRFFSLLQGATTPIARGSDGGPTA
jgi:hypothetical protein